MSGRKTGLWFVFLILTAVSAALAAEQESPEQAWERIKAETGFPLSGEFLLVSERSAAPASGETIADQPKSVSFGASLRWLDGQVCPRWSPAVFNGIPFDLHDPNLSDMIIGPLGDRPNHRLSLLYKVLCGGVDLGWLVVIDKRVAIAPSADGTRFAILVMPPSESEIRRVQAQLAKAGLHDAPATGELDERTQAAIAEYAHQRGAVHRFARPAMTMNLLDGLGVLDARR